ncbi:alpha/beta fold hydrolase [Paenibacillus sp. L3-i20]|uniref:alpha/beta fold hydrolase n=1 Tax=Paenibacillus sp. L3-i20 TaxID=2905833 RepID=UPI001EDD0178|nr:alpha/beta hydrolase [Paenibacillus sp. L3-i20]GKU77779.1 sigma factor SigB regulation protein RsbQ [Paenibacillus sp. L3-i20]
MHKNVFIRNNVNISGKGTKHMIFAHGFGCDQNMWRFVAPTFESDYRVVLFDFVGSGKSDIQSYDTTRYSQLDGYAQDLLDICEEIDLKEAVLVGHSVGAIIGILASIKRPEFFNHLILIGPSPRYINEFPEYIGGFEYKDLEELLNLMAKNHIDWSKYLAPLVMGNAERPALAQELEESFCSIDPIIAQQFANTTFFSDNRKDLPKVSVPSLILQCSQDVIAPLEVGAYVHLNIPNSTFQIMEAIGHCPHMSHPLETIELINEYLDAR